MTPEPDCDGIPFGVHSNPYTEPAKVVDINEARAPVSHPLTELGAAESFAADCGGVLRYDHRRGRWLIFEGHRWHPDDCNVIIRIAVEHVRRQQHMALANPDVRQRGPAVSHWMRFDRRAMLDNLLGLAKSLLPIADTGAGWDADPCLLGCTNGVLDLWTAELRNGQPEDKITMTTGIAFDWDAPCLGWQRFISQVLTDPDVADFVWRALGYALTGDMREQCFFLLFGRGANGKSTLIDIIGRILGDYALVVPFATFEAERKDAIPVDVASMEGKRFVAASEGAGRWLHSARLKDITGGEKISARHLYGAPFTFRPACKVFLSTNELPKVADDSEGLWRRLRQIPFTVRFEGTSEDRNLKNVLLTEAPGILSWLVRGCLAWQSRGLAAPVAVADATAQYRADSDVLARFFDEACELVPTAEIRASELFTYYKDWATQAGLTERERLTATMFGKKCTERFTRVKTRAGLAYRGVARA